MRMFAGLITLALLAGCGGGDTQGGLTADENAELNNAAAMLDSAPEALNGVDETGLDANAANEAVAQP